MGGLFGSSSPPPVIQPPEPPTRSDAEVRQAALDARLRRAAAVGRAETIATSPSGVKDEVKPATKTLLGQ